MSNPKDRIKYVYPYRSSKGEVKTIEMTVEAEYDGIIIFNKILENFNKLSDELQK